MANGRWYGSRISKQCAIEMTMDLWVQLRLSELIGPKQKEINTIGYMNIFERVVCNDQPQMFLLWSLQCLFVCLGRFGTLHIRSYQVYRHKAYRMPVACWNHRQASWISKILENINLKWINRSGIIATYANWWGWNNDRLIINNCDAQLDQENIMII